VDYGLLEKLVLTVEDFLESIDVKVPFFVAGGSVYSTINCSNHYDDIDVFFYNQHDRSLVVDKLESQTDDTIVEVFNPSEVIIDTTPKPFITDNAISVSSLTKSVLQRKIQFIKLHVGDVHTIFSTFDFNCSKVAFTSSREFIKSDSYTKHITVDVKNINGMVFNRYFKYRAKKGGTDDDYSTLKQIAEYLIDNYTVIFDTGYKNEPSISGHKLIDDLVSQMHNEVPVVQYIHDYISDKDERLKLDLFSKMPTLMNKKIVDPCDELYLFIMLRSIEHPTIYKIPMKESVKLKYPEYFI
jgi:hypothetical protein